ncbi:MAG: hypothetical protein LKE48_08255 [Solobacterium sp.]|nr:hypothetical protein [Solobacterium sp.]
MAPGELKTLINTLSFSGPAGELAKTADGTYEILAKTIACEISLLSPEAVYVHSAMAPDIRTSEKHGQRTGGRKSDAGYVLYQ